MAKGVEEVRWGKDEIRAEMRNRRKAITPAERAAASAKICERLLAMELAEPVAVYLASSDEIDLSVFISACSFTLAAPRWNGAFYELAELCGDLMVGPHGILEPPSEAPRIESEKIGAWIVPGLAFAKDGTRLGYGGGWYDRLMATARTDARKIGVGYRFQIVDALPAEPHDVRLDEIIHDGET